MSNDAPPIAICHMCGTPSKGDRWACSCYQMKSAILAVYKVIDGATSLSLDSAEDRAELKRRMSKALTGEST